MIGIYGIFRKADDKCMYVGQSKDINGRIKSHLSGRSNNTSFNKDEYYGEMIEQHFIDDRNYRLNRESYWINELNPELNVVRNRTFTHSIETRKKMSEHADHKGEKNSMYGKHHTKESNEKNRQAHLGKPAWNKGKIGLRGEKNGMYGKHHTKESNEKNRQAHLGENNSCYGKKWINNGEITKYVKPEELDKYIQDGWKLGRLPWKRNS